MKSNDAMQLSVNKIGSGTLNIDGLEIQLFRHTPGIGNTESSGNARHALPNVCVTSGPHRLVRQLRTR